MASTEGVTVCAVGGCGAMAIASYPETPLCSEHRGASAEHRICEEPHCYTAVLYGGRCKKHHVKATEPMQEKSAPAEMLPAIAPPPDARPIVRHGDVAAQLFNELRMLFHRVTTLESFERHVMEAAKSPAAWLALRQELSK